MIAQVSTGQLPLIRHLNSRTEYLSEEYEPLLYGFTCLETLHLSFQDALLPDRAVWIAQITGSLPCPARLAALTIRVEFDDAYELPLFAPGIQALDTALREERFVALTGLKLHIRSFQESGRAIVRNSLPKLVARNVVQVSDWNF